jgi:hypothetical protein
LKRPDRYPQFDHAASYLAGLWGTDIRLYTDTTGTQSWLVDFPLPLVYRKGEGMDFMWSRPPFEAGIDRPGSVPRTANGFGCGTTPPTAAQIKACSSEPLREAPGADFLLAYWLVVYLHVI